MLEHIAEWSATVGAVELRIQPLLSLGRGIAIASQRLSSQQLNELVIQLSDISNRYRRALKCGMIGVTRRMLVAHPCAAYVCNGLGCHRRVAREIKKIVIREDGTVFPEITNLSREFAIGNINDGPLPVLVSRYFNNGYEKFDRLCRLAYSQVLPEWEDVIVPWDQIVADESYRWHERPQSGSEYERPNPVWDLLIPRYALIGGIVSPHQLPAGAGHVTCGVKASATPRSHSTIAHRRQSATPGKDCAKLVAMRASVIAKADRAAGGRNESAAGSERRVGAHQDCEGFRRVRTVRADVTGWMLLAGARRLWLVPGRYAAQHHRHRPHRGRGLRSLDWADGTSAPGIAATAAIRRHQVLSG
jgi:hypothetical protein